MINVLSSPFALNHVVQDLCILTLFVLDLKCMTSVIFKLEISFAKMSDHSDSSRYLCLDGVIVFDFAIVAFSLSDLERLTELSWHVRNPCK